MANEFRATLLDFTKTIDSSGQFGWLIGPLETIATFLNPQLTGEQFFKLCIELEEARLDRSRDSCPGCGGDN